MKELVSIVVPVYNAEKTLERCVRSLRSQTYENIEIVLVNDGSKDGSLELCRRFAREDSRIRVVDKPNGGVSSARNAGIDAATGEFILFCDSDDWVDPEFCACMQQYHAPQSLTVCRIDREDIPENRQDGEVAVEVARRREFLHYPMLMCSPVNKLYIRSVIEENGLRFPEDLSLGEDFSFVLSYVCALTGEVRFLNRALYYYDVSIEDSLSKRKPTLEQCDLFFRLVTSYMERLGATDPESIRNRDQFAMTQFENMLIGVSQRRDLSFREKMALAGKTAGLASFRGCSGHIISWGNPIYRWLFRRKAARLIMLYLLARQWKRGD